MTNNFDIIRKVIKEDIVQTVDKYIIKLDKFTIITDKDKTSMQIGINVYQHFKTLSGIKLELLDKLTINKNLSDSMSIIHYLTLISDIQSQKLLNFFNKYDSILKLELYKPENVTDYNMFFTIDFGLNYLKLNLSVTFFDDDFLLLESIMEPIKSIITIKKLRGE